MIKTSEFLETMGLGKGFSKPNLFQVELFPPEGLNIATTTLKHLSINCKSATLPGRTLDSNSFIIGGYLARAMPIAMTYTPVTLTFHLSTDHREKTFFEEWQKMVYNEDTNTLGYYDDFIGSVSISQLNRKHEVVRTYQLNEAWPGSINEVTYSSDAENQVAELTVSLWYRNYKKIL